MRASLLTGLACLVSLAVAAKAVDPRDCEELDSRVTPEQRKTVEGIESVMQTYCDVAKGKEKTMCYYMGIGDKELGTAGGVKREISGSLSRGINAKRLCTRMKKQDAQMCELRFDQKFDVKNTDLTKLRVKELRKICEDEGIPTKDLLEKGEFIKAIQEKYGIKDEV